MLMQDSAFPLYKRVKDQLRARMLDGTYSPETQLPTEQALCDMFEVSRITVRQALDELRQEGAVKKVQGRGTFVAPPRAYQNIDALQGFSEAMAPLGHQVSNRLEGLRFLEAGDAIRSRLDMEDDTRVAEIKRVRLLDGAALSFETTYLAEPLARRLASLDLATRDIFGLLEEHSQIRIDHANVAMDAIPADEETAACPRARAGHTRPADRAARVRRERPSDPLRIPALSRRCFPVPDAHRPQRCVETRHTMIALPVTMNLSPA
jgi:GntR family transcriptional regulator